jgi:hypothetical protein
MKKLLLAVIAVLMVHARLIKILKRSTNLRLILRPKVSSKVAVAIHHAVIAGLVDIKNESLDDK